MKVYYSEKFNEIFIVNFNKNINSCFSDDFGFWVFPANENLRGFLKEIDAISIGNL